VSVKYSQAQNKLVSTSRDAPISRRLFSWIAGHR
jgi:hypothetical protein